MKRVRTGLKRIDEAVGLSKGELVMLCGFTDRELDDEQEMREELERDGFFKHEEEGE